MLELIFFNNRINWHNVILIFFSTSYTLDYAQHKEKFDEEVNQG